MKLLSLIFLLSVQLLGDVQPNPKIVMNRNFYGRNIIDVSYLLHIDRNYDGRRLAGVVLNMSGYNGGQASLLINDERIGAPENIEYNNKMFYFHPFTKENYLGRMVRSIKIELNGDIYVRDLEAQTADPNNFVPWMVHERIQRSFRGYQYIDLMRYLQIGPENNGFVFQWTTIYGYSENNYGSANIVVDNYRGPSDQFNYSMTKKFFFPQYQGGRIGRDIRYVGIEVQDVYIDSIMFFMTN